MLYHGHGLDSWRWGDGWDEGVAYVSSAVEEALCGADGARYAFDVKIYAGQPFLCNRRLFAMADVGIPDGIKCDVNGNVYSGCGDGVSIWSPGGVLLAKILVEGGVANFCFGREGQMFLLNENRLWRVQIAAQSKGALLGI